MDVPFCLKMYVGDKDVCMMVSLAVAKDGQWKLSFRYLAHQIHSEELLVGWET